MKRGRRKSNFDGAGAVAPQGCRMVMMEEGMIMMAAVGELALWTLLG